MKKLDPSTTRYLVAAGLSEKELRNYVESEHRCLVDETGEGIDVNTEVKNLMDRIRVYERDHNISFRLRGRQSDRAVWLNDKQLSPEVSQSIKNHSPDGFNWSYGGSGPAQLALAICIELLGPDKALEVYQTFKFRVIASLPQGDFDVTITIRTEGNIIKSAQITRNGH